MGHSTQATDPHAQSHFIPTCSRFTAMDIVETSQKRASVVVVCFAVSVQEPRLLPPQAAGYTAQAVASDSSDIALETAAHRAVPRAGDFSEV